jgi:sialate O-acetylesterase
MAERMKGPGMTRTPFVPMAIAAFLACSGASLRADVTLPKVFGDDMVLQRDMPVPVWGWAEKGEKVTVIFAGQEKGAVAGENGTWRVNLDPMKASKAPAVMKVSGKNEITFKNVLVGEVWLCSGQSNMEMALWMGPDYQEENAQAAALGAPIRYVKVGSVESPIPSEDITTLWWCGTNSAWETSLRNFTAVGYFFAKELVKELDVPVGLINASWGGTRVEPWISPAGFESVAELADIIPNYALWDSRTDLAQKPYAEFFAHYRAWLKEADQARAARKTIPKPPPRFPPADGKFPTMPTRTFNGMIHPLAPYAIRGALWYQGESNWDDESVAYLNKMKALINGWRALWKMGEFSFYVVQLPNYYKSNPDQPAGDDGWRRLREAQLQLLAAVTNTGMAVTIDIGEADNIHPKNKRDVGARLAAWALAKDYGKRRVYSGPLYKGFQIEGGKIRISFDSVGAGLMTGQKTGAAPVVEVKDGKLAWFAIAGEDRVWKWADATIDGGTVLVSCPDIESPVAVRYAFASGPPEGSRLLYNRDGFPASPFRTDDWADSKGK